MNLKQLRISNFLSVGEATVDFSKSGCVSIVGVNKDTETADSNGSGKTSIADALMWCIYEETMRGKKGRHVKNRYTQGVLKVELDFESEGVEFCISRKDGSVELFVNGKKESRIKGDVDNRILSIFPSKDIFCLLVYMSNRGNYKFSNYKNKDRTEMLEELICLSIYDKSLETVRSKYVSVEKHFSRMSCEIIAIEGKVSALESRKSDILSRSKDDKDLDEMKVVDGKLNDLSSKYDKSLHDKVLQDIEKVDESYKAASRELDSLKNKSEYLGKSIYSVESKMSKFKSLGDKCPTCYQEIDSIIKKSISAELLEEINKIASERSLLNMDVQESESTLHAIMSTRTGLRSLESTYDRLSSDIATLTNRLCILKNSISNRSKYLESEIFSISSEIEKLLKDRSAVKESLDSVSEEMEYLSFWKKGFSSEGIRNYKLNDIVSWMNDKLYEYASMVLGEDIKIELSTKKELIGGGTKNSISIEVDYGGGDYESLSDSESDKVDFAIHLALREMAKEYSGVKFNILIIDEIFKSFDRVSMSFAMKAIDLISKSTEVYVISHKDESRGYGDRNITVIKESGVSRIQGQ